jgi:crotonobetainyl-CoA:carnitine CoA-transferase CaiB-like acyl-CoA transferase
VHDPASAIGLVRRVWGELGREAAWLERLTPLPVVPLPARLDVSALTAASVALASLAAATAGASPRAVRGPSVRLDGDRIATACTSERWFRWGGEAPDVWAPLSGFRRTADGWVRTHANYPWHASALRLALGLPPDAGAETVDAAIAERTAEDLEAVVTRHGGLCVAVRAEDPADDADRLRHPLIELPEPGAAPRRPIERTHPGRPLAGLRVLDLTRVIAGPVGTRTLALLGADVLRIDPPELPEPEWQHLDTGAGKRSALLDLDDRADRAAFDALLAEADAIVLGYRPSALHRLGLDPAELVARHPRLVVGQLSAWGYDGGAGDRRGFDSLVQAASGIAWIEGDGERPGALPAQALDHATGYLLATAVVSMLDARGLDGRVARLSLRRTAAELLRMPRSDGASPAKGVTAEVAERHLESFDAGARAVRVTAPAVAFDGGPERWPAGPRGWGRDAPGWAE